MNLSKTSDKYVVFKLGNEYNAIDITSVLNIEKVSHITRVPKSQHFVIGVFNLRGEIIPIVNLQMRLGLGTTEITDETRIIVVKSGDVIVGILADSASEVLEIDHSNLEIYNNINSGTDSNWIKKIGKHDNRMIIIIDLEYILGVKQE